MTGQNLENEGKKKQRRQHRGIRERWIITGVLTLDTPANFGGGQPDDITDIPIITDESDGLPLLPGTSIAGALRSYLRTREFGDGMPLPKPIRPDRPNDMTKEERKRLFDDQIHAERNLASTLLFGGYKGDDDGIQSPLIVHDAVGSASGFEFRDGVRIDGSTGAAEDEKKFDFQLLCAGSTFGLRFELIASEGGIPSGLTFDAYRNRLLSAAAAALTGLSQGDIYLGTRKNRGFGRCSVSGWTVRHYDMITTAGLLNWLTSEREGGSWGFEAPAVCNKVISEALGNNIRPLEDVRQRVSLTAEFSIDGSVMIRSGFGKTDSSPDMVHLHSYRPDQKERVPVISGASWAGVLRHRALKIARTLSGVRSHSADRFINSLFGPSEIKQGQKDVRASRIFVDESRIIGSQSLVQSRIKIDRFTGGVYPSALFDEQPVFGNRDSRVLLTLTIRPESPENASQGPKTIHPADIGLVLLLLKDLWTGDLHIGGESGVGRGRLLGQKAMVKTPDQEWTLIRKGDHDLEIHGDRSALESYVQAFNQKMET